MMRIFVFLTNLKIVFVTNKYILIFYYFLQMAKHLCEADVDQIYFSVNDEKFAWQDIVDIASYTYLSNFSKAFNFPLTFIMGTLIPAVASLCGSKTTVKTGNFVNPLNTFAFIIGEPGCGKSRCKAQILMPMNKILRENYGISLNIENYTSAGFQRHQSENKGYGLLTSGEGQKFLASIHAKLAKNEGEESRLNSVWDGVGDETLLKDGTRGYDKTAVSMAMFIQPEPFIAEMVHLYSKNGFMERLAVFCSGPQLYMSAENDQAVEILKTYPEKVMELLADAIFKIHYDEEREYILDEEAKEFFKDFTDKYNAAVMARHNPEEEQVQEPEDAGHENGNIIYFYISIKTNFFCSLCLCNFEFIILVLNYHRYKLTILYSYKLTLITTRNIKEYNRLQYGI